MTMAMPVESVELHEVACEVCLKEVPLSEAVVPEAQDYVAYFCGLDCYERWKAQREPSDHPDPPSPGTSEGEFAEQQGSD